jgi:hypothetical protein
LELLQLMNGALELVIKLKAGTPKLEIPTSSFPNGGLDLLAEVERRRHPRFEHNTLVWTQEVVAPGDRSGDSDRRQDAQVAPAGRTSNGYLEHCPAPNWGMSALRIPMEKRKSHNPQQAFTTSRSR